MNVNRFLFGATSLVVMTLAQRPIDAAQIEGRIRSDHIRVRIAAEREWLGRDAIIELERCWQYIYRATGEKLPRAVLVEPDWTKSENSINFREFSISIGMNHASAGPNPKSFLLQNAAREMARLGLAELSNGGTLRDENRLLVAGMTELLAREYDLSSKGLTGAWVIAHFLDRIKPLSLATLSVPAAPSTFRRNLLTAAPGLTFLLTCRQLEGRGRLLKVFEAMKKGGLKEALISTYRSTSPAVLEDAWLRKIRSLDAGADFTATSEEDAPQLQKTVMVPPTGRLGVPFEMRLFIRDGGLNLDPGSVFVEEKELGLVVQGRDPTAEGNDFTVLELPMDSRRQPGSYRYRITAVDESGNVRNWEGNYTMER